MTRQESASSDGEIAVAEGDWGWPRFGGAFPTSRQSSPRHHSEVSGLLTGWGLLASLVLLAGPTCYTHAGIVTRM
jgi:hypothetical protein